MDTEKVYNENASKWLRLVPSSLSDFTGRPAVFEACGDVDGRSVFDIGCGEGYCARELKKRGAGDYLGVDLSSQMIEAAKTQDREDQYGIDYRSANILEFSPDRQFDLCVAVFLFNYTTVAEMHQIFKMVYAALNEGGHFVFSVPHPFFPFVKPEKSPPFYFDSAGKNYFASVDDKFEGEIWKQNGEPLHVQCVHKTFGDYFVGLQQAGFSLMPEIRELTVTPELITINKDFFTPLANTPLHVLFKVSR
ncbi:MAG: class I SAM-dependent methyltransferase [Pseudomonadota bacterium]